MPERAPDSRRGRPVRSEVAGSAFDTDNEVIQLPKGLGRELRALLVKLIEHHGHLKQRHLPQLIRYAELSLQIEKIRERIAADGPVIESAQGGIKSHPLFGTQKAVETALLGLERSLILCPGSEVSKISKAERDRRGFVATATKPTPAEPEPGKPFSSLRPLRLA